MGYCARLVHHGRTGGGVMDLRQIRTDLGTVAGEAGYSAWSYQPDDPQALPAAVVGGIHSFERLNVKETRIELGVTFYVSLQNAEDAAARLDLLLSVGDPDSFVTLLDAVDPATASWFGLWITSAGPYQRVAMPDSSVALSVELVLQITA